jgi:hypothetical protein
MVPVGEIVTVELYWVGGVVGVEGVTGGVSWVDDWGEGNDI